MAHMVADPGALATSLAGGYAPPVLDTATAAQDRYFELLRAQSPAERLAQAARLTTAVRELAEAGLRHRHPGAPEQEIRARLAVRLYGREMALRFFPSIPPDAV